MGNGRRSIRRATDGLKRGLGVIYGVLACLAFLTVPFGGAKAEEGLSILGEDDARNGNRIRHARPEVCNVPVAPLAPNSVDCTELLA